jgi:polysaccharide pyruvyl transferase WcaK-like protein
VATEKIILFNLHYSPNLGDGLIGACMVHALSTLRPGAQVVPIDISGRNGFGAVTVRNRNLALKVLRVLPLGLRQRVVHRRLSALLDGVEDRWRKALDGAGMALIGGGQLFSDADLNFPVKMDRVGQLLAEAGVPAAIHAVGVSENWTPWGRRLFSRLCEADLRAVGVRDAPSLAAWRAQAGGDCPGARLTRDPGLLSEAAFGPRAPGQAIALGITAPDILSYHADAGVAGGGGIAFYEELALSLVARAGRVRLFCNGADEDAAALAAVAGRPAIQGAIAAGQIECARVPATPKELVDTVATCRAVISHRLHACILGHAYGRPVVGMGWDRKVESFFDSVGLESCFVGRTGAAPATVADIMVSAIANGVDRDRQAAVIRDTWEGLESTLADLTEQGRGAA